MKASVPLLIILLVISVSLQVSCSSDNSEDLKRKERDLKYEETKRSNEIAIHGLDKQLNKLVILKDHVKSLGRISTRIQECFEQNRISKQGYRGRNLCIKEFSDSLKFVRLKLDGYEKFGPKAKLLIVSLDSLQVKTDILLKAPSNLNPKDEWPTELVIESWKVTFKKHMNLITEHALSSEN